MDHNLWTVFAAVATAIPDRDAVRAEPGSMTFGELAERSVRLANVLAAHDLGHQRDRATLQAHESGQDLVGTYLLNGPEYLEVTLGGYAARTAPFNVNYRYVADELAHLLNDADAGALIYHSGFAPRVAEVLPRVDREPLLVQVADDSENPLLPGALDYETALAAAGTELEVTGHDPDDLYVLYTGGTTGMPKGTLWRQADIWTAALGGDMLAETDLDNIAAAAIDATSPRFLPNAPFMHGAAHWLALRALLGGGTVVLNSVVDRLDPVDVWTRVQDEAVDTMLMVGESFARPLLDEFQRGTYDSSSIQLVVVGGAATSPETKRRLLAAMPKALILDAAGSSETGSALSAVAAGDDVGESAVFIAGPGTVVLDAALHRVLEPGDAETGWFAKSGAIPLGYLGDENKTKDTFPTVDGVRYSVPGDRARHRGDGMVELLGRDSVTINSGGEKIFAEEVEAALLTHPAVGDVVVVGRDSPRWGQEVVAVLSLADGAQHTPDDELVAAAAERVARYKLPKQIVRVDHVLRSPAGKADYRWAKSVAAENDIQTAS